MCKVISVCNQKGGCGKSNVSVILAAALVKQGQKVLVVDADPQGSCTISLGYPQPDEMEYTLADILMEIVNGEKPDADRAMLHQEEGIDLIPANITLSALEVSLVGVMSREMIMNREINGREFDFCILMKNVGLIIVEVKGWLADSIFDVAGVDEIIIQGYSKPEKSPKKQARAYRFGLLNMLNDKFNVSPLIFDMVCYPFISKKEYYEKRLDIASEEVLTIFKEDLEDASKLGNKLLAAFNQCKTIPHAEMDEVLFGKIRQHFEPHFVIKKLLERADQIPYSILSICPGKIKKKEIHDIVNRFFAGTKTVIFVESEDSAESVLYVLEEEFNERCIEAGKNLKFNNIPKNDFGISDNAFRVFNFELYIVDGLSGLTEDNVVVYEGKCSEDERHLLECLAGKSTFNIQQYGIEHADSEKNILVKAGAGTGKTYSMVSRVSYLCNRYENPIVNVIDDIAMVTFTNDAADNMKKRLKQLFINYYVLTGNPKYLNLIEDTDLMRISTIHKFARELIKESSLQMGLGDNESSIL